MIKISVITSLYNCINYLKGYFEAVEKIVNKEECEYLLLHNAPKEEELRIIEKEIQGKPWFQHIIIDEREGLYKTWNRGIKLSQGKYCAVWNVDDIRFPDSFVLQLKALDDQPECGLVTGHNNATDVYGEIGNRISKHDRFERIPQEAYRSCLVGCFPMWRKSVHNTVGYFDEQFKCVSDFDFQIRVALKFKMYCVTQSLGVYLENDPNKISNNGLQIYENNIIYLRYGVYEKLVLHKLKTSLKRYKIKSFINFSKKIDLNIQKPFSIKYQLCGIFTSLLMLPKFVAQDIYHSINRRP